MIGEGRGAIATDWDRSSEYDRLLIQYCHYGVPQTRRRFVLIAFRDPPPQGYCLPQLQAKITPMRPFLFHLVNSAASTNLPNHAPSGGFKSKVHQETEKPFPNKEIVYPVRFSRPASDGHPIRCYDEPFPAIDTATVWGWAQGTFQTQCNH